MMIARSYWVAGAFALLACCGFVPAAAGEPEASPARADGEAEPERLETTSSARLDAKLLARLEQLQATHRAARNAGLKDPKAWSADRVARAARRRQEIAQVWGNVVGTIDGQAHLRIHAERMARLNRMLDLAEEKNDGPLSARVRADIKRELIRHARAMQATRAASGSQ
jgi:hypothetical protein